MATNQEPFTSLGPAGSRDLGFGQTAARGMRGRLLNRDGTFNASRHGYSVVRSVPIYEHLTTISWGKFYLVALVGYLLCVTTFAFAYLALGPQALEGDSAGIGWARFAESWFFSVHTVTTVGYGSLTPATVGANVVVAIEALVGVSGFAVMAALLFARLSRPSADIRFSVNAVMAPYRGGSGLMFRIANGSRGELVEASVRVILSWIEGEGAGAQRRFEVLDLERKYITFFPMHWTVVHPIGPDSPLQGWTEERFRATHPEILIQVTATAETYSKVVRARGSYVAEDVVWNARFADILEVRDGGAARVDVRRLGDLERLPT